MGWRRILFVLDCGNHVDPRIVRKVVELARGLEAEVELFEHAFEWGAVNKGGMGSLASDVETRSMQERRRAELDEVVTAFQAAGVRARGNVSCEKPAYHKILRHVLDTKPDLLIIQSRPHGSIARLVLTYSDFKLIETVPCPLLLIKSAQAYLDASVVAAVDPMHRHGKLDLLDDSIMAAAGLITGALGGTLHVCHAIAPWKPPSELQSPAEVASESVYAEVSAGYSESARLQVSALARRESIPEERVHVVWGDPTDVLPRVAHSVNASVVVMGAVSRTSLERIFIGHTAERVLDALECDVLVVKPPDFESPVRQPDK